MEKETKTKMKTKKQSAILDDDQRERNVGGALERKKPATARASTLPPDQAGKEQTITVPVPYRLTPREQEVIDAYVARRQKAKPLPRQIVEFAPGRPPHMRDDHEDTAVGAGLSMEALGLTHVDEYTGLLQHVIDLTHRDRKPDEKAINEMLARIAAVEPRDGVEAMLATQMAAVHQATIRAARQLRGSETIPQQDSNSNMLNKLTRTFSAQVEALKRYRSKGEQKVVVEHVTVNEGGQAIVGKVEAGGGGSR